MSKLKANLQRLVQFFLASLFVVGSLPLNIINTYAADVPTNDAPAHQKTLTPNGDGTYTIKLSVTGKASSSTTQEVTKSNVILLIDTSSSMNTDATGYEGKRIDAEKDVLRKTDGIIDKLLAKNGNTAETADIIELYGINFDAGATKAWDWSTNGATIKEAVRKLSTDRGTNWEEALSLAKAAADAKREAEPNDNTYVILLTDGQPTTHYNDHSVSINYSTEWGYASDDARAIVNAGYTLYGIYTFGPTNISSNTTCDTPDSGGSICLKGLINYAYTGTGDANSSLSSNHMQYFYDATDTQALINALETIVNEITSSVGYTNIAITDGLTDLTSSMKVDGKISNLTYTRSGGSYGSGTVWTDAPKATTTSGGINWNLGSRMLEDGVTYTVSFVVWPAQESYDLIADLNNGRTTYDELTDSQKASIIRSSDGGYTLKTNTDHPTLTYSTVTTTTSNAGTETVVSEPTTINIENPKPVGLATEKLTLEKKWEDSLDPSQREEVEEVVLDFYKDSIKYEEEIHLNPGNGWKLPNYISIAPGIMISSDSSNYNALKAGRTEYSFGGKKYIILETGHDYHFEEDDINNHYELTNYIYHPMIVDNTLTNVFFSHDTAGNISGIREFKVMDSVSATNTLKGGINIEKKVVDQNNAVVDTDDSFTITAHLLGNDGKPYGYDYRIYYGEKNPEYTGHIVYDESGNVKYSRSEHIYGTGDLTETLYVGDVIRIVNVDSGVQYYVEESEKAGYAVTPTIEYKEKYGSDGKLINATSTSDGYYAVSGNTSSNVTIVNKFLNEKTKVDFEKTWYGRDGNVLSGKNLPGSVTIELFKKGADNEVVSTGKTKKVNADTEWKGSFTDLPKYDNGTAIVYSIKENAIEGATYNDQQEAFFEYDSEENNGQHAVVGKWKAMTFEDYVLRNVWTPATESVTGKTSFKILKVDKGTGEPLTGATFELKSKDGATTTVTTNTDGEAIFNNLDAGEYTLKETNAPEGYKAISTEPNVNITKIKKLNAVDFSNLQNFYEYVFSFSTSQVNGYKYDAKNRTFTVENEPIPYNDIIVSKVWGDDADRDGLRENYKDYYVAIKDNKGKYVAYEKLVLENKNDYKFAHLPLKTVDGEDISYTIVEASTCSGKGESIKCTEFRSDKNYTAIVEGNRITNKHEPELINEDDDDPDNDGKITVQKVWTGEGNELARPNAITVELYANGKRLGAPVTLTAAGEWKHTFEGLYKNENGKPIVYSVEESKLGETAFGENQSTIVVYSSDDVISGSWTKSVNGHEITNTWKEATDEIIYDGANRFYIKKVDEEYQPLEGVSFSVNGANKITDAEGIASKSVPVSKNQKEESFEFVISEKATLEGYDLVEGSATVTVTCTSVLTETDASTLTNTYVKNCSFKKSGSEKYVWDDASKTLTVVNNRSLAKSLKIQKTTVGLKAEVLKDLEFTITGPEDFGDEGEMTLRVGEGCKASGYEITCEVDGKVPTGTYTVKENNAEIDGFTLTVSGDDGVEKKVNKDDEVVFEIKNAYEVDEVMYFVDKIWEDAHDKDGKRPEKLTINLLANGEIIDTIVMTMNDAYILGDDFEDDYVTGDIWGYVWENLPYMDEDAEPISYTVEEVLESEDYEQAWVGGDEYATTFVNYHELEDDPCAEGGCGGFDVIPTIPTTAPNTGRLSLKNNRNSSAEETGFIEYTIGTCALGVLGIIIFVVEKKNHVRK